MPIRSRWLGVCVVCAAMVAGAFAYRTASRPALDAVEAISNPPVGFQLPPELDLSSLAARLSRDERSVVESQADESYRTLLVIGLALRDRLTGQAWQTEPFVRHLELDASMPEAPSGCDDPKAGRVQYCLGWLARAQAQVGLPRDQIGRVARVAPRLARDPDEMTRLFVAAFLESVKADPRGVLDDGSGRLLERLRQDEFIAHQLPRQIEVQRQAREQVARR